MRRILALLINFGTGCIKIRNLIDILGSHIAMIHCNIYEHTYISLIRFELDLLGLRLDAGALGNNYSYSNNNNNNVGGQ